METTKNQAVILSLLQSCRAVAGVPWIAGNISFVPGRAPLVTRGYLRVATTAIVMNGAIAFGRHRSAIRSLSRSEPCERIRV